MPHYNDGTPVQIGDIARGKGYNHPFPVQGVVVGYNPAANSCNIQVALPSLGAPLDAAQSPTTYPALGGPAGPVAMVAKMDDGKLLPLSLGVEYGVCSDFELVHRPQVDQYGRLK